MDKRMWHMTTESLFFFKEASRKFGFKATETEWEALCISVTFPFSDPVLAEHRFVPGTNTGDSRRSRVHVPPRGRGCLTLDQRGCSIPTIREAFVGLVSCPLRKCEEDIVTVNADTYAFADQGKQTHPFYTRHYLRWGTDELLTFY